MRRGHVGAVCALALMFVFACGVVRETYLGKVKDVVEAHHEAKDSWDITAAPNKGDWTQYDISKAAEAPRRPLAIQKRGLRPSPAFRKAFKTGKRILNMMEKPAQERQTFTDPSDLQGWGWTSTEMSEDVIKSTLGNYAVALKAKGISVDSPTLSGVKWTHSLETVHDGVKYPATGGSYALILDPSQGLLIPTLSYGPQHHLQNTQNPSHPLPATTPPPKLQHWADIAYLTWSSRTTPETRNNLKYIAAINAINEHTVHVVSEALKKDGVASGKPPGWPGHVFTRVRPGPFSRSEVFPAVLGTPNLRGAGWLVAQYWEQLGARKVGAVTVFDSSGFLNAKGGVQVSFLVEVVG